MLFKVLQSFQLQIQVRSVVAVAHEALDKLHAQAQEKQPLSPRRAVNEQAVLRVLHEVPPCFTSAAAHHILWDHISHVSL